MTATGPAGDEQTIRRGAAATYGGYLLKAAYPVLWVAIVHAAGAAEVGTFMAGQAAAMWAARVALLGFDKAGLWWTAHTDGAERLEALRGSALAVLGGAALASLAMWAAAAPLAATLQVSPTLIRALSCSVPAMVAFEWTAGVAQGLRHTATHMAARELVLPLGFVALALAGFALERWPHSTVLAASWVVANLLAAGLVAFAARALLAATLRRGPVSLPRSFTTYAGPLWLAELANSALQRLDVLAVAHWHGPAAAGVYGVVAQFGNAVRQIRRSFDPVVSTVFAGYTRNRDAEAMRRTYGYAARLLIRTQFPVFAGALLLAPWIFPLLGGDFAEGSTPFTIFAATWMLTGAMSLTGVVLTAVGHSRAALTLVVVALAAQAALLVALVPQHGLVGAALSVSGAYALQSLLQVWLTRRQLGFALADDALVRGGFAAAALSGCAIGAALLLDPAWGVAPRIGAAAVLSAAAWWILGRPPAATRYRGATESA